MPMNPRLLRPTASGSFDPRSIGTMLAWYDFSDTSSLTLVNGFVSEIRNKSGLLPTLTQDTEADRPSLGTLGGRQAGVFDGNNDVLFSNTSIGTDQGIGTIVAAYGALPSGTNLAAFSVNTSGPAFGGAGSHRAMAVGATSTTNVGASCRLSSTVEGAVVAATGSSYVVSLRYNFTLPFSLRANGNSATSSGSGPALQGNAIHVAIGARNVNAVYGAFWNSTFGEALYYKDILSDAQVSAAEQYLRRKWGVTFA
jgi:hypothetical protein